VINHGNVKKKHFCEKGRHIKGCRPSRPLCKYRRAVCRCAALHFPHRPGSVRGCREGGIPEVILKSRSYQQASRRRDGGWRARIAAMFRRR
jgi:hypothetical protein